jgi:hypothetical protein
MGLQQIPAATVAMPTRRTTVFTSSQTWTVPSSAMYVDVMVVGGGTGGDGGISANTGSRGGTGGAITVLRDIYLGGTGTVSIVVGAGGNGGAGRTDTSQNQGALGGFSGFGTFVYSSGGLTSGNPSLSGYKGTTNNAYNGNDATISNFAPIMTSSVASSNSGSLGAALPMLNNANNLAGQNNSSQSSPVYTHTLDGRGFGYSGGVCNGSGSSGGSPGGAPMNSGNANTLFVPSNTTSIPWSISTSFLGTATGGGTSASGTTGGLAGSLGFSGSGGASGTNATSRLGGAGGPGAGGGGGNSTGGINGGNGGNAGTNTGGGGGGGGSTGSANSGTGGNGGNGGSGFVIVSYIGTN